VEIPDTEGLHAANEGIMFTAITARMANPEGADGTA
jgi:hypothetical protein